MKKALLTLLALSATGALHAQNNSKESQRSLLHMQPDVQHILRQQMPAISAKGAAAVNLIGSYYFEKKDGVVTYQDSVKLIYSGGRGSNLDLQNWYTYYDFYYPFLFQQRNFFIQEEQTLKYDTMRHYYYADGAWYMSSMYSYNYNSADQPTLRHQKGWNSSGELSSHFYDEYTYDVNGNLIELNEYEDTTAVPKSGGFRHNIAYKAYYNSDNQRTKDTIQIYGIFGLWKAETYTYNSDGKLASSISQAFSSGEWVDYFRSNYTYDSYNRLTLALKEYSTSTGWVLYYKDTLAYTGSSSQYTFWELSKPYVGITDFRYINTLNSFNATDSFYYYDMSGGAPEIEEKRAFYYNASQYIDTIKGEFPGTTPTEYQYHLYYDTEIPGNVSTTTVQEASFATIYPNPATASVNISITQPSGLLQASILNMAGQLVYKQQQPAAPVIQLPIATLPAGLYTIQVEMNGQRQTLKLEKQ